LIVKKEHKPKVLVIVGPTASGKTSLSITLAKAYGGEIVSADSRQVYRGLDLGSGKVTPTEMRGVPHHLLDVADPRDTYTVTDFVRDGRIAIADILERGKLPIIVGGSFFYVDALLGRISTPEVEPNFAVREALEKRTAEELFAELEAKDPVRAKDIDRHNPRRLVRALEIIAARGSVPPPVSDEPYDARILGVEIDKEQLHKNIHTRLLARLKAGMLDEVRALHENGLSYERMEDLGLEYRYLSRHLQGFMTYDEMVETLETKIRQFAKRQMTWLKRDQSIQWGSLRNLQDIQLQQ
jgi:tRNA dimethylallyltransferase